MRSSRFFAKALLLNVGLNLLLAVSVWLIVVDRLEPLVYSQHERRLLDACRVVRVVVHDAMLSGDTARLQKQVDDLAHETGLRLTMVAADGRVLADSSKDADVMDNHLDRPELQAAAGPARFGIDRRTSASTGKTMHYCALSVLDGDRIGGYVRVAAEARLVETPVLVSRRWLILAISLSMVVTSALTILIVQRLVRPVDDLAQRLVQLTGQPDEPLGAGVSRLENVLAAQRDGQQANADRLANVLANMAEGVLALDAQQRIILANDASRKLLDFVTDELHGRPLWEVLRNRVVEEAVAEAIHSGRPTDKEFESLAGTRRVLALRASRLPGEPSPGVMLVLHDVTDLRRLENLRREFVANVSHELKTPLASIKAYAETLRMGAVNDPEHNIEFVGRIEEQSDRLHQLILDLLHLARVESGQEAFEITSVLLSPVVENCVRAYQAAAQAKHITVDSSGPAEPVWVRADEEGVRTILNNLVDNAIKYTPDGGRVTVRWGADRQAAWLEVQDTGIGIGRQHQARIFERFYRVDKARSRELGGTGLGLSIVKHLAQAFGGSVGVESQLRGGSTFRVTLPLAEPTSDRGDLHQNFSAS